jgi:hypothetical protein
MKVEFNELKSYKEKYSELLREHKAAVEERTHLEKQLERSIQNKEINILEISKQCDDQVDYYKRITRESEEKAKNIANKLIEI